jgi:RNA polymerase sigma-70 factor (ECF subfamily)
MDPMTFIDVLPVTLAPQSIPRDTETIWNEFGASLRRFIRRRVADEVEVDDILQDVFLKIHANIDTLRDESKLLSWIYRITRHAVTDYYRSQRPFSEIPENLAITDEVDEDLTQQLACGLWEMVEGLPIKYREALILAEYQGLTQQEIATRLGISLSGAKSRVQRARDLLKGQLLQCCHVELDRLGKVIDYYPHRACCANRRPVCTCRN